MVAGIVAPATTWINELMKWKWKNNNLALTSCKMGWLSWLSHLIEIYCILHSFSFFMRVRYFHGRKIMNKRVMMVYTFLTWLCKKFFIYLNEFIHVTGEWCPCRFFTCFETRGMAMFYEVSKINEHVAVSYMNMFIFSLVLHERIMTVACACARVCVWFKKYDKAISPSTFLLDFLHCSMFHRTFHHFIRFALSFYFLLKSKII